MSARFLLAALCAVSAHAETITGTIYCDNYFQFWFNGELVATDPISFTPHNAVSVSFEWDGVSDKVYAIMCQDYASSSGYEYVDNNPGLGDGALMASFSDGTVTSSSWKSYVVTFGPTDASYTAGCSSTNLDVCEVDDYGTPDSWYSASFDDSAWSSATGYTVDEVGGYGRTPSWTDSQCCTMTSPVDRSELGCNVDSDGNSITVTESECLEGATLDDSGASMIWGTDLDRDNKMLFRYTASASSTPTPGTSPSPSTPSPGTSTSSPSSSSDDLSTGAIVGIVVGCVVGVAIIVGIAVYCLTKKPQPAGNAPDTTV